MVHSRRRKWHVHTKQGWVSSALVFASLSNAEVELFTFICPFSCSTDRLCGALLRGGCEGGKIKGALSIWKPLFFKAMYRDCNYWQSFCLTWVKIDDYAFRYLLRFFQYFPGMKLNSSSSYLNNASFCCVHWPLSSSPNYAWFPMDLSLVADWLQCAKQHRPSWMFLLEIRYLQSFPPRGILWFLVRGELRTAIPSAGKQGAGSPLSTWTSLGGVWNLQKQNYLWHIYCQSNSAAMTNGLKNYGECWWEWEKTSYAASGPWGSAVFSSAQPLARAAFQIIADHGSSNTSSQNSSRSFSEDTFFKAWIFWNSMLWSWLLAGVSQYCSLKGLGEESFDVLWNYHWQKGEAEV